jgi:uncharacterized protein YbdZ (MbtH family)
MLAVECDAGVKSSETFCVRDTERLRQRRWTCQLLPRRLCKRPISFCSMSNTDNEEFGIIANDEHEFSIWPTHCKLLPQWHYTGPTGTQAEMQDLLSRQFLTTLASTYLRPETRFMDSQI